MKPSPHDHPDLTAYVLGELNNVESARVRQLLAQSPEARAEHQRITQMVNALREQAPPIPRRALNPRQRETILAMGQPRTSANPGRDHARRIAWGVAKLAAAASVTAGAFALGMKYADRLEEMAKISAAWFHPAASIRKILQLPLLGPLPNGARSPTVEKNVAPSASGEVRGRCDGQHADGADPLDGHRAQFTGRGSRPWLLNPRSSPRPRPSLK